MISKTFLADDADEKIAKELKSNEVIKDYKIYASLS
jgi:hypothetical protein